MLKEIIENLDYTFIKVNVESEEKILKLFQSDIEYEPTSAEEFLYLGVYHRKDSEKAMVYYQQAGELGNSIGYHNMAFLYVKRKDFDKAKIYYEKAGELGHVKSIYDLANLCAQTGDFEKATIYYEKAVEFGYDDCVYPLALLYDFSKNYEKAKIYYEIASKLGHVNAMHRLGLLYEVEKCNEMAIVYHEKAAVLGKVSAMYRLGHIYDQCYKDDEKARFWYKKAADLGDKTSMNNLACFYVKDKDYVQAEIYYKKAADFGLVTAMTNLGHIYSILVNHEKSLFYYKKAADLGDVKATHKTAQLLTDKDPLEAEKYYIQAVEKGHEDSISGLYTLYKKQNSEKAFLLAHKYVSVLGHEQLMDTLSLLTYPISDQNKDQIYVVLETFDMPKDQKINSNLFCIMQDVVARKVKIMCDIAFYYKKYNK